MMDSLSLYQFFGALFEQYLQYAHLYNIHFSKRIPPIKHQQHIFQAFFHFV